MQGPNHLDHARTLANELMRNTHSHEQPASSETAGRLRRWTGHRLITIGERLAARPTELQLKVSTGPPCP